MAGFSGDPQFTSSTSGWTGNNLNIARDTSVAAQVNPFSYKWGSNVAGGNISWTASYPYAATKAQITAINLIPGNWYFIQAYLKASTAQSPRLQMYANNKYGNKQGAIPGPFTGVGSLRFLTLRFRADNTTQIIDIYNYDPVVNGSSVYLNGLFIVDHKLDPTFKNSIDGWENSQTLYPNHGLNLMPGMDITGIVPNTYTIQPRDTNGSYYDLAQGVSLGATIPQYTSATVFSKDDCTVGRTYQVLLRVLRSSGIKAIPVFLQVDDKQISWNSDQVNNDWIVIWGTFVATSTKHDIKIVNGADLSSDSFAVWCGLEVKEVTDVTGESLSTLEAPKYPARINQTLYPCQPGWDDYTVPQLVRQFQYMKEVGITELVLEQVINMTELRAYYDTGLKTAKMSVDPVSGATINLPVLTVFNDLVDRIIEAKDIVGGIDLWWGIGRYWPWESTPASGTDVISTVDSSVKWSTKGWAEDQWKDGSWGRGTSAESLAVNKFIVQELVSKYGPHIKGWYLPLEIESYGATYDENLGWFRCLFYELTKMALTAKNNIPIMVSPFYQDLIPEGDPNEMELKKRYAQMLINSYLPAAKYARANGATKFILAQQDGLGDVARTVNGSKHIYQALFNTLRFSDYSMDNFITLWHNLDLYDVAFNNGNPMDPKKLQDMMNATNLLEKRTSFSFASQLTPQMPTRRPYWSEYRKYVTGKSAGSGLYFELDY